MKRISIFVLTLMLLTILCACGKADSSDQALRALIPQEIDLDSANYPLLSETPPAIDTVPGDTPRTIVFDESAWTGVENPDSDSPCYEKDGVHLIYDPDFDVCSLQRGSLGDDLVFSEDYLRPDYEEELPVSRTECDAVSIIDGTDSCEYIDERQSGQIRTLNFTRETVEGDRCTTLSLTYDPLETHFTCVFLDLSIADTYYACTYDNNGKLGYFSVLSDTESAEYDSNYRKASEKS